MAFYSSACNINSTGHLIPNGLGKKYPLTVSCISGLVLSWQFNWDFWNRAQWLTSLFLVLGKQRQEDCCELEDSQNNIKRPCLNEKKVRFDWDFCLIWRNLVLEQVEINSYLKKKTILTGLSTTTMRKLSLLLNSINCFVICTYNHSADKIFTKNKWVL